MTTADWIKTRRELLDDATPGPWEVIYGGEYINGVDLDVGVPEGGVRECDAALIADIRTSLPRALDALDAVRALHPREEESPLDSEYGKGFAKGYNRALDDARSRIESVLRGES